jgi:hypothetical protein
MYPEILAFPLQVGTVLIGPPHRLTQVAGATSIDIGFFGPLIRDALARDAAPWRLRSAAIVWGVEDFDPRQRTEQRAQDQIARMGEAGRLAVRFLPLFLDDPRRPGEAGLLRVYRLGGGPANATAPPRRSASAPPPQRTQVRSAAEIQKDFEDEDAQIAVLRAAAKDGTPFCEQCARAAVRRARAAHDAA